MDTKRSLAAFLLLLVAGLPAGGSGAKERPARDTVLILHTNDVHSHLLPDSKDAGGLARIGGYVAAARAKRPDVLLLDAGDAVTGTPASSIFRGRPVFSVMNAVGYDAMALGNHEFDNGFELVAEYREIARFPILCANVTGPDGEGLADERWRLFDADGVKVGVIGVVTEATPRITAGGATEGCRFHPAAETVRRLLPEVEKAADLVVVLSHLGHEEDRALAREVPGIDVIVGGHSHTVVPEPVTVGDTIVTQAGSNGRFVGRLELTVDLAAGKVVAHDGRLVPVDGRMAPSPEVAAVVEAWEERVRERTDVTIGTTKRAWTPDELRTVIERAFRETLETDLAFQNRGGTRAALDAGDVTIREIWTILPFDNTLVTVRVKGVDLPEWAVERIGGDFDLNRVYTVATNSFVADHADRYFPRGHEGVVESGRPMRETFIEWIRKRHGLK